MDNKILVVVTFFHREFTLNALEKYYLGKNVDILVVDQSYNQIIKQTMLDNVIDILHYPANKTNFYQMWLDLVKKYSEEYKYFVWNNDDDFTIAESLNEIQDFLNTPSGKKYTCVTGQVMQIGMDLNHFINYATFEAQKNDVTDNNALKRLNNTFCLNGVHVNPHAVIRTDVFEKACNLILKTENTDHSLMPIKFFDKIITAVASLMGYRKTNFNNVTSVRTERDFTGSLMQRPDFPECLEKQTEYPEILKRLKNNNVIAKEFGIDETKLLDCLNPSNIKTGTWDRSKPMPHGDKSQISRIKQVYSAICKNNSSDYIKKRLDILGYAVIYQDLETSVIDECLALCTDESYPRGKSFKATAAQCNSVFSLQAKNIYANDELTNILHSYGVQLGDVFITHEYKQETARNNYLHFDRLRSLKVLTYLTDVTDSDGPFCLVQSSHTFGRDARRSFKDQPDYEARKNRIDIDYPHLEYELTPITGPAGTTIIFDSDIFHLGGKVNTDCKRAIIRSHWYGSGRWREIS